MPPRKTPLESAKCHMAEAHRKWTALVEDDSVSAKHRRCMKAAVKSLDKAMAKLKCVGAQSGGAESAPAPGQIDRGQIVSNSSGLVVKSHDPMGPEMMDRISGPRNMPQPFSINDDPTLHLPTSGIDPSIKSVIAPTLGYVNNYGTTQVATLAGGGKRRRNRSKRA